MGEAVVTVTHAVMIRLAFVQISGISDESWRRPVGRPENGWAAWPVHVYDPLS